MFNLVSRNSFRQNWTTAHYEKENKQLRGKWSSGKPWNDILMLFGQPGRGLGGMPNQMRAVWAWPRYGWTAP